MKMDSEDAKEMALRVIRTAFFKDELPQLIGEATGKEGVLMALVGAPGDVHINGNSNSSAPRGAAHLAMVKQMAHLLWTNLKDMQSKAVQFEKGEITIEEIAPTTVVPKESGATYENLALLEITGVE
jgi:hypothetical protein